MAISAEDAAHLLRRAGFGGKAPEIQALTQLDRVAAVDKVLNVNTGPAEAPPEIAQYADSIEKWKAIGPLQQWWMQRMANTNAPIVEKMALFWHSHFPSNIEKAELVPLWEQNQLFRTRGMGSFRQLCQAVAIGPAMLDYLDNRNNTKDQRNENFARELMELFTIGEGNYTQADVVAVARAWTGHGSDEPRLEYVFDAEKHDAGPKTFRGVTRNWNGPDIINALCSGSLGRLTATTLARKLWTYFAYADPAPELLAQLVNVFVQSELNIKVLLRAIFTHDEFYSATSKNGHVRSPVEYMVASARYTGIPFSVSHPEWHLANMGQNLFNPPNVAGWPGDKAWINSANTWAKGNFARSLTWAEGYDNLMAGTETSEPRQAVLSTLGKFGIDRVSKSTVETMTTSVASERAAKGWAERHMLIVMSLMSPEFQVA